MCNRWIVAGILVVVLLSSLCGVGMGATIYVAASGNNGDGLSWANAKHAIADAITAANHGDLIFVKSGTYSISSSLVLKQDVSVYGGFAGTESRVYQRELSSESPSVLDGSSNTSGNDREVIKAPYGVNADTALDGFTVTGGAGFLAGSSRCGGGIYICGSGLTIGNCLIESNTAYYGGGIFAVTGSTTMIHDCTVTQNVANYGSGIVFYDGECRNSIVTLNGSTGGCTSAGGILVGCYSSSNLIKDTEVSDNVCNSCGGGIYVDSNAHSTIQNCNVHENHAVLYGAGIYAYCSAPFINQCTVSTNSFSSTSSAHRGAGIAGYNSSAHIADCTIEANTSPEASLTYGGGMYFTGSGSPLISSNVIHANTGVLIGGGLMVGGTVNFLAEDNEVSGNTTTDTSAAYGGGGIYVNGTAVGTLSRNKIYNNTSTNMAGGVKLESTGSGVTLASNLIYSNASTSGSGIQASTGTIVLDNNTIVGNSSDGLYATSSGAAVTMTNNIVALNATGIRRSNAPTITFGYNDIYGNTTNFVNTTDPTDTNGNISQSPSFTDSANHDYSLASNSPCLDTGTNSVVATDARDVIGNNRILASIVDMGSYEYGISTPEFTPAPGAPSGYVPLGVRITCNTPGVSIYFTLDGTTPTESSHLYDPAGVVIVGQSLTLKAKAYKTSSFYSDVATGSYGSPPTLPTYIAQVTDSNCTSPVGLWLDEFYETNQFKVKWAGAHDTYTLQRIVGGTTTTLVSDQAQTEYIDTFEFTSGSPFTYQVKGWGWSDPDLGLPAPDENTPPERIYHRHIVAATDWVPITITPIRQATTDNQTVDSRLDLRYEASPPHYADHQFGDEVYKGGLFAGFANTPDNSRVGRSFLKFEVNPMLAQTRVGASSVNAYHTLSTPNGSVDIACLGVNDDTWTPSGIVWTNAPTVDPSIANSSRTVDYGTLGYFGWPLASYISEAIQDDGILSACLASKSETTNQWVYFAKKEYDTTKAPTLLYAYESPDIFFATDISLSAYSVEGGQNITGTVRINDRAPVGGCTVSVWASDPTLAAAYALANIEEGQISGTFVVSTAFVGSQHQVDIRAATGFLTGRTVSQTLTINP